VGPEAIAARNLIEPGIHALLGLTCVRIVACIVRSRFEFESSQRRRAGINRQLKRQTMCRQTRHQVLGKRDVDEKRAGKSGARRLGRMRMSTEKSFPRNTVAGRQEKNPSRYGYRAFTRVDKSAEYRTNPVLGPREIPDVEANARGETRKKVPSN
jgi:hypothetical protein